MPITPPYAAYIKPAVVTTAPGTNPTAPASTSAYKMQGIGACITPQSPAGVVLAIFHGTLNAAATTVGNGIATQIWYGPVVSGTAIPANAGAIPSTAIQLGTTQQFATGVTLTNAKRCDYECVAAATWISALLGAVSA